MDEDKSTPDEQEEVKDEQPTDSSSDQPTENATEESSDSNDNASSSEESSSDTENSSSSSDSPANTSEGSLDDKDESPEDALTRTPEDLDQEKTDRTTEDNGGVPVVATPVKKPSAFKRFFKKVNIYFLFFALLLVIAGAITIVNYLNNQKANPTIDIATQELADKTLEQLANTDVSVGNNAQTLTIQGNAIIAGQTLMRGSANVAGNFGVGGTIQGPSLTISGSANLGQIQSQTVQIQNTLAVQGATTLRDLNVSGSTTFSGPVAANQLTVTRLILAGNATLEVPNHISFTGPVPNRGSVNSGATGTGGTISVSGSDTSGTIDIRTGNSTTPGCFTQITFNQPFSRQPRVIISPVGAAAGQTQYYTTRTTTSFSICTANSAPANQSFSFDYFITN